MSRHQKRITIPKSWPIPRKTHKWSIKCRPGPHSGENSIPLLVVVRDMLKLADNAREAKRILNEGNILVDGRVKKDNKFPVGIFDVISIPKLDIQYRMLLDEKGKFNLHKLEPGVVRKLTRIEDKTILKGGRVQLNLSDGSNKIVEDGYSTGDSLVLSIPEKDIVEQIEFKEGNLAMVLGGSHSGEIGTVKEIEIVRSSRPNKVMISGRNDFETIVDYVFMIGIDKPAIKLGAEER